VKPAANGPGLRPIWTRIVDPSEGWTRAIALGTAATALTLIGSFLNFLNYNGYPIGSSEVLLVLAGMLALSVVIGVAGAALGVFGRLVLPALLVVQAVELNFSGTLLPVWVIASVLLARFARQGLILLFGVVVVSELGAAVTGAAGTRQAVTSETVQAEPAAAAKPDLAIVHLILDEHIGLEGIPDHVPGGPEMREKLRSFYLAHGFRLFGGAYSESMHTVNAIPRMLGLQSELAWKKRGSMGTTVEENPYFDTLQSRGFQISVVQTDWVDYCNHPAVKSCVTRVAGDLIDVGDKLPVADKAALLAYRFAMLSTVAQFAAVGYDFGAVLGHHLGVEMQLVQLHQRTGTNALNAMATLDWATEQARTLAPGRAMFAHILLPHFPYSFDGNCGIRPLSEWLGRTSAAPWEERYAAYFDQVTCTTRQVEEVMSAIAASPAAGKTIVIIHGDHGSRITEVDPRIENDGRFSDRDLVDAHATFFAVAAPRIEPGYDPGRYPLRLILNALTSSGFRAAAPALPPAFVPTIQIENIHNDPVGERSVGDKEWWQEDSQTSATAGAEVVP
jgi:hypothetical protein